MNPEHLLLIYPQARGRVEVYAPLISQTFEEFSINTPERQAAWLAQVGWESGQLRYTQELGDADYFQKYEGRADLGNTSPGDGLKYRGHGLIQITGKGNHRACGVALSLDLVTHPELLTQPEYATRSAGWFWSTRGLNEMSDDLRFGSVTKRINGGYTHLDQRIALWITARRVLGC